MVSAIAMTGCGEGTTSPDFEELPDEALLSAKPDKDGNGKGNGKTKDDGGHIPVSFSYGVADDDSVGVHSDGEGDYVNDVLYPGGAVPVVAHFANGGGRNAYLETYYAARPLTYTFAQDVLDAVQAAGYSDFPTESFQAPSHVLIASDTDFTAMVEGETYWLAVEFEFYPTADAEDGTMYEVHYSSLPVRRIDSSTWDVGPSNCSIGLDQGWADLSVRRRKQNRTILRMGSECGTGAYSYLPAGFTIKLVP